MQLTFPCPHCAATLGISDSRSGATVRCPACADTLTVPAESAPPPGFGDDGSDHEGGVGGAPAAPQAPLSTEYEEETFRLGGKDRDQDEMDLTPMVDVTFLLLIFFMITASFSVSKTLQTPPPEPEEEGVSQQLVTMDQLEQEAVVIRLEEGDAAFVDDEPVATLDDLPDALRDAVNAPGRPARGELVIEAADEARHEAVVAAYDAAADLGLERIRLAVPAGD